LDYAATSLYNMRQILNNHTGGQPSSEILVSIDYSQKI